MNKIGYDWADSLAHEARPVAAESRDSRRTFAEIYPREYEWIQTSTFGFALKMRDALKQWGQLTSGQFAAVQKCMQFAANKPSAAPVAHEHGPDLKDVPSGMYADPNGTTRLKVCIAKPQEGKWKGWAFVSDGAAYSRGQRYGAQKPDGLYQGQIKDVLRSIAENPAAAMAAYGHLTGRCGVCNRPLEDEESVRRGIGPICAGRRGW